MAKRRPTARTARRARERAHAAMVEDLERLARLAPGGSPERPLEVESPAQVEVAAEGLPCPLCDGPLKAHTHDSVVHDGVRLRVARVECVACGTKRDLWFRLAGPVLH
jgi:hypothetical protein